MSRSKLSAAVLCALALLSGCATKEPAETIGPSTSTVPSTTTTTEPPATLVPAATFEQAAADLLKAWRAGDRASAAKVAQPQAVELLFSNQPGPTQNRGCDQAQLGRDCAYRYGSKLLRLKLVQFGNGWIVEQAEIA